jgi:predicted ATPase
LQKGVLYKKQTNWYVITGGPGSGKTTTVNLLKNKGYTTTIENARHYIDTLRVNGKTVEEIRKNQIEFQQKILDLQLEEERSHPLEQIIFLDRAIPDALAYYRFLNIPEDDKLSDAIKNACYKKIFILDPLPLVNDYARTENATDQKKIHLLITEVYTSLGYPIIHVPVLAPEARVNYILKNI